jgi:hypothetical protein
MPFFFRKPAARKAYARKGYLRAYAPTPSVPLGAMAGGGALARTSPGTVILASSLARAAAGIGRYVGTSRVLRSARPMPDESGDVMYNPRPSTISFKSGHDALASK